MAIRIREGDIEADGELIANAIASYLTPRADQARFDWLYKRNPHGQVRVWLAMDGGETIGTAAAFPRRLYIAEEEKSGWVLGDFCVSERYRSLGPALQLQKTCLAAADAAGVAFCYDFPSRIMLAIYQRLGLSPSRQMVRLAKPLRVDREVAKMVKNKSLGKRLSAPANLWLSAFDKRRYRDGAKTFALHDGICGEEFSRLSREIGGGDGACVQRSAEYLNWRYLSNPLYRYELVTARCADTLLAYGVFYEEGEDAMLVDLFGIKREVIGGLIEWLLDLLRKRGVVVVSAPILESHPFVPLLRMLGFREREASPFILYTTAQSSLQQKDVNWYLMHGDRDS